MKIRESWIFARSEFENIYWPMAVAQMKTSFGDQIMDMT
jgi:hypothetical protein